MEFPSDNLIESNDPLPYQLQVVKNVTASRLNFSPRVKLTLDVLMVLMCVGAVTGNVLVILIVAATKTFHSVTSVLIINLAISDLLVGIGVMPFVAISVINKEWVECTDLCLYVGYTSSVYCTASVLTLAAIALDRYHSIVDCLRYSSRCTMWRTGTAVFWIWAQAAITSLPPLFGWGRIEYVGPMFSCAVNWSSSTTYTVFMATLTFLLPATVILFCYLKIVRVARSHARRIHHLEDQLKRNRRCQAGPLPSPVQHGTHMPASLVYYLSGGFLTESSLSPGEPSRLGQAPGCGSPLSGHPAPQSNSESSNQCSSSSRSGSCPRGLHTFMGQFHTQSPDSNTTGHGSPSGLPWHFSLPSQSQSHGVVRLFAVIAAFFLCWTPYMGMAVVQAAERALSRPVSLVPPSAITFSYWLVLLNSDINPLLYALLSQRFQGALRGLRCKLQAGVGGLLGRPGPQGRPHGGEARRVVRLRAQGTTRGPAVAQGTGHGFPDGTTCSSIFTLSSSLESSGDLASENSLKATSSSMGSLWCH